MAYSDRDLLELMYDGEIPADAVAPRYVECITPDAIEAEMRYSLASALDWWKAAKLALRNARIYRARVGWAASRNYVNRCRQDARDSLERRASMKKHAADCAERLRLLAVDQALQHAAE